MGLERNKRGLSSRIRSPGPVRLSHPPSTSGFFLRKPSIRPPDGLPPEKIVEAVTAATADSVSRVSVDPVSDSEKKTDDHKDEAAEKKDNRVPSDIEALVHNQRQLLGVIYGSIELALLIPDARDKNSLLLQSLAAVRRLDTMTTSVLTLSASTDRLTIQKRPLNLGPLLHEIVSFWQATAKVRIRTLQLPPVNPEVNEFHMKQIMENLISNAEKYGKVALIDVDFDKSFVRIHVSDQGPGFSSQDAPESSRGSFKIGLKYCEKIIEAHGGMLTKENITDEKTGAVLGARVTVQIPLPSSNDDPANSTSVDSTGDRKT